MYDILSSCAPCLQVQPVSMGNTRAKRRADGHHTVGQFACTSDSAAGDECTGCAGSDECREPAYFDAMDCAILPTSEAPRKDDTLQHCLLHVWSQVQEKDGCSGFISFGEDSTAMSPQDTSHEAQWRHQSEGQMAHRNEDGQCIPHSHVQHLVLMHFNRAAEQIQVHFSFLTTHWRGQKSKTIHVIDVD